MNVDNIRMSQMGTVGQANFSKPQTKAQKTEDAQVKDQVDLSGKTETFFPFTKGNKVEALTSAKESLDKIDKMITGAKDSVQVQMYRLGHTKIVGLLADQAKKGVKVQVLLDDTPGYDSIDAEKQTQMREFLQSAGVEVLRYPTGKPEDRIDHVKMMIVDKKSLLIGGMNWDQHSVENVDQNVVIQGPVVGHAQAVYQNDWKLAGGKPLGKIETPAPLEDGDATVRMLTTEPDRTDINTALQDNIKNAKKSIYLEAFAIADKNTIANLCEASQRGVDVKVILDPNQPIFFVNKKSAETLTAAGVKVKWYDVDVDSKEKLHSKMAIFDEETSLIGSANFTKKGLEVNHEANVEVISKAVGTAFTKMFDNHWETKSLEKPPYLPDFNERPADKPTKEIMGREIFRYFTENFHPDTKRIFSGKKKEAVLEAIDKFDKTDKAAPVISLGAGGSIDEMKEMETIGDLASFFGDLKDFQMKPTFEDNKPIYDARVEISKEKGSKVHEEIPRLMNDMVADIKSKDIQDFVKKAIESCPEGFYKAPSASTGKHHPADEVDPAKVDLSPTAAKEEYKGGGLVLHSRRVQVMAGKLCDHYGISGREKDEVIAAAALHDMMKSVDMAQMKEAVAEGKPIVFEGHTRPDHGIVASEWIKSMDQSPGKEFSKNIAEYCNDHMAVWNQPQSTPPSNMGKFIVSMADYSVSQNEFYLEV